ncbi:ArnT family glycosyltransferase [Sphingomicrobium flavum]|uniref:ArnT family glycosyltransferase n=1 Tax=Sphingomicrobium flavum TaxID=1229164 RepID=UPI0021ADD356|nr:glycosyltransferase family 39 protein [Sphingomicrobium flavum]
MADRWARLPYYFPHLVGAAILVWIWFAPAGIAGLDETIYFAGADALRKTGSFAVENGASQFNHDALRLYVMVFGPNGLVPQYPVGSALAGAPMLALFGLRGMMLVNALAAVATLFVTRALARQLFKDDRVANVAPLLLAVGTFFPEFAFAVWPHAVSILCVTAGLLLALRAFEVDRPDADRQALLAGLVIGIGLLFRMDTLLLLPGLGAIALFYAPRPVRSMLLVGLGMVPALVISSFANQQKFGSWNPITYGKDGGFTALSTHVGPAIFVIVAGLALLGWRHLGFPHPGRKISAIAAAVLGIALLVFTPTRDIVIRYLEGFWGLTVDARTIEDGRSGIFSPDPSVKFFWGHSKQAIAQSAPWIGCLFLLVGLKTTPEQRKSLLIIAIVALSWSFPLFLLSWHGGGGNNMRYLAPLLPLLAILACWLIAGLMERVERPYFTMGWGVVLGALALALHFSLGEWGAAGARQDLTLIVFMIVCLACVVSALLSRWYQQVHAFALAAIGAGLMASYFSTITSISHDQTDRWVNLTMSKNFSDLPQGSIVMGGIGLMMDFAFKPGHILVLPSEDPQVDDEAFVREAFAKGYRVYTFPWVLATDDELSAFSVSETSYRWSDGYMLELSPAHRAGQPLE